ncbi:MAG TPA: enoyl-CoA hydratase-related protein [Acidimicrobiales bacterium]|nr:enoyl-CoA hydratase-related protein [Acidimicrobiales bacterium]
MPAVLTEAAGSGVVIVTLNRPEVMNALTPAAAGELAETLTELGSDRKARAVVLTGAGRGFCAGAELGELSDLDDLSVQDTMARGLGLVGLATRLTSLPQPIIAAVNGPAMGVGLGLALACDTRVCSESARFGAAFPRLGLSGCEIGLSYLLPRILGPTVAFEFMLTGRSMDAAEAAARGLVLRATPDAEVVAAAVEIAGRIAANSPFGMRMTKEVMWTNLDAPSLGAAMALETRTQTLCLRTRDQREAIAAFLEKRPAVYTDS